MTLAMLLQFSIFIGKQKEVTNGYYFDRTLISFSIKILTVVFSPY